MPNLKDKLVVGHQYAINTNGRKLLRLGNGWLVAILTNINVYPTDGRDARLYVSEDNGETWYFQSAWGFTTILNAYNINASGVAVGNRVYIVYSANDGTYMQCYDFNTASWWNNSRRIESIGSGSEHISITANEEGTQLHVALQMVKTASNDRHRYYSIPIQPDGTISLGNLTSAQVFVGANSSATYYYADIALRSDGSPIIFATRKHDSQGWDVLCNYMTDGAFKTDSSDPRNDGYSIFNSPIAYTQARPSALSVPGVGIMVAWHGLDDVDATTEYIRFAKSTDDGASWPMVQKIVPGKNPSLTANRDGHLFIGYENEGTVWVVTSKDEGSTWSSPISIGAGTFPSTLVDRTTPYVREPFMIRQSSEGVSFSANWTKYTVSPESSYIGVKTTGENFFTYTVTSEGEIPLLTEKLNGVTLRTYQPANGKTEVINLSDETWESLAFGKYATANGDRHTVTLQMLDNVWSYTFEKQLPLDADILTSTKAVKDSQEVFLPAVKSEIARSLTFKGINASNTDTFEELADKVGTLGGKRWASGTVSNTTATLAFTYANGSSATLNYIAVSGLTFTPSLILIYGINTNSYSFLTPTSLYTQGGGESRILTGNYDVAHTQSLAVHNIRLSGNAYVNNSGFLLPNPRSNSQFNWIAFE